MAETGKLPCIWVLAGTNGAGKSSVLGEMVRAAGGDYFNPDEAARSVADANPGSSQAAINSAAWAEGKHQLERAIAERMEFRFETTLGGHTIAALLAEALSNGMEVRIWYVGLSSPELHIARVQQRVARGGHDIPESQIRERYRNSLANLIQLLPNLTELRLFDNSEEGDPEEDKVPKPTLILHMSQGKVQSTCEPELMPEWTRPVFEAIDHLRATKSEGQSSGS